MANPVYHVTFTKDVADIQKRGLDPLSQSLWEKAETGERYQQDPSVYGFSDPKEALNWATKMAWEFEASPSDISILTLEGGDHWQKDPSGDLNLGQSAQQSLRLVEPSEVLDVFSLPEPVGTNAEFQEAVPGGDFEDWKDFYSKRLGSRPTDQSNLPAVIDAAAAASRLALPPDDEPRPKGKAFGSGVGSLMRRRMFPLIQALQQGYEHLLTEEQKNDVREFLAQPTHEFFGFEKSGLESLKEKLGISDDMPGETFSVIEGRTEKPLDEVSQSTIKRRLRAAKNELSDLTGIPVKRDVTQRIQRRIQKLSKEDPLLEKRLSNLVERIYDLKERISPDTRFGPVSDLPDSYFQSMARQREETEGTLFRALGSLPSEYLGVESDWFPQDLGRILSNLSPDRIRSIDALLKQRDGRGLLDHTFPKTRNDMLIRIDPDRPQVDSETVRARIQDILDPEPPSYLRLVDEEPPDTGRAHGGFVVKPLYDS